MVGFCEKGRFRQHITCPCPLQDQTLTIGGQPLKRDFALLNNIEPRHRFPEVEQGFSRRETAFFYLLGKYQRFQQQHDYDHVDAG